MPDESGHLESKNLMVKIEEGDHMAITSVITLLEVVSTVSRAYTRFSGEKVYNREQVSGAFLKRVLNIRNLSFIPAGGEVSTAMQGQRIMLPVLFNIALEIGAQSVVKTLDNLHLASASIASRVYGKNIDYFVTLDKDILDHMEDILRIISVRTARPSDIL